MKQSTIAIIGITTLLLFHGAHIAFGFKGVAVVLLAVGLFCGISWALYWRQLRMLHKSLRDIPPEALKLPEAKDLAAALARLDSEAHRDLRSLDHQQKREKSQPSP